MGSTQIILAFVLALVFVLLTIIKFNLHPFLSLILGGIIMGVVSGLDIIEVIAGLATGFGNTMAGIGILIISGIILGDLLHKSGAMEEIANLLIEKLGADRTPLAMNLTGIIVSIPVFFDAAFVILVNLAKSLSKKGKIPFVSLVTSLSVGLIVTHAVVIPTPGPTSVAGTLNANVGWFIFYGIIVSLIGATVGGVVYGRYIGNTDEFKNDFANAFDDEAEVLESKKQSTARPSGGLGILLILFPILLILLGSIFTMVLDEGTSMYTFFRVIGDKNIALLISVFVAYFALRPYLAENLNEITSGSTTSAGSILAITGAGGSFGAIIGMSGIGDVIVDAMSGLTGSSVGLIIIIVAYLVSALLRMAQGSTTVALVTTSAIFAPILLGVTGVSSVLVGLAICAGGAGYSLPNDSGFWVVSRFSKLTTTQTLKTWTAGGTIASLVTLAAIVVLSFLSGLLPGLI